MTPRTYRILERSVIGLMLLGMVAMFQPFTLDLFRYGFLALLLGTILFIVVSHLAPKAPANGVGGPGNETTPSTS
jgi:ABC-type thiamin/hydroxymethylpyrimidine transport system permease subunit